MRAYSMESPLLQTCLLQQLSSVEALTLYSSPSATQGTGMQKREEVMGSIVQRFVFASKVQQPYQAKQ